MKINDKVKNINFKKINFSKITSASKKVYTTLKLEKVGNFFRPCHSAIKRFFTSRAFSLTLAIIVFFLAAVQVTFSVLVYKYKSEDKITRVVAKIVPFPVAVVNYDFITYNQFLVEKDYIHHFYASTKQENIDLAEVDKQVLTQLVENKIISFEARDQKIKVSNADVDAAYGDIVEQNGGQDSVNKVLSDLYGINATKFKSLIRTQLLRDKMSNELIEKVTARHILVRVDAAATDDQVAAAKVKIQSYLDQIKGGADFGDVAKKNSEDVGSAEQGGLLEPFAQGEMVDAFSQAAFSTPVGQISDPIRTEFGWHIIKVESKTGKIEKTFADWLTDVKKENFTAHFI